MRRLQVPREQQTRQERQMRQTRRARQQKIAIVAGVIIVAIILVFGAIGLIDRIKKSATLEIRVTPLSADITIDGKKYQNGTLHFEPGTYHVKIAMDGFDGFEKDIELAANKTSYLYHYLTPLDGSMDWYLNHPEDEMMLNTIGDHRAEVEAKEYLEKDPILALVPYRSYTDGFNIDVEFRDEDSKGSGSDENDTDNDSDSEKVIVKIELLSCRANTQEKLKKAARKYLTDGGVDLDKYEIRYVAGC